MTKKRRSRSKIARLPALGTCKAPDRDIPKLTCGYPLPCPFHTVIVVLDKKRPRS